MQSWWAYLLQKVKNLTNLKHLGIKVELKLLENS